MVVRLWSLQVLHSSHYQTAESIYQHQTVPLSPTRGLIIARGGQVLVGDRVLPVVTLKRDIATPVVIGRLAALLGETVGQVSTALTNEQVSDLQPVPIAIGVSQSTIVYLAEHKSLFPGVAVSFTAERTYPFGDTAAQLLGYIGDIDRQELHAYAKDGYTANDVIGQSGVEATYEHWLRGHPGSQVIKVDALGNPVGVVSTIEPKSGDDVVLNVDVKLQQEVEGALNTQITKLQASGLKADSGAAVVLDPETGAVLAMASVPTYNPAWYVGGISDAHLKILDSKATHEPGFNRAIDGLWAPGSTFKLATATAALNDGLLSSGTYINDPGYYQIKPPCSGVCTFYDNTNNGQHEAGLGQINVTTALTASDDVFFYTLGADYWYDAAKYGQTPIQNVAEPVRLRRADRRRRAGRAARRGPGGQPASASDPVLRTPAGLRDVLLRHRRQHRDGLRPGRDRRHPVAGGGGVRHLRERWHAVRPAGGECDRLAVGPVGQAVQAEDHGARPASGEHLRPDPRRPRGGDLLVEPPGPRDRLRHVQGLPRDPARGQDWDGDRKQRQRRAADGVVRRVRTDATGDAALRRRRRDRPGRLRCRRRSARSPTDLPVPERPPRWRSGPPPSCERSLSAIRTRTFAGAWRPGHSPKAMRSPRSEPDPGFDALGGAGWRWDRSLGSRAGFGHDRLVLLHRVHARQH